MFNRSMSTIVCVCFCLLVCVLAGKSVGQEESKSENRVTETDDRKLVVETVKNFYIGDHTGSIKHKKLSMHKDGAYRYINKQGEYVESKFRLDSDNSDPSYNEELLGIEVYENVALARLRLEKIEKKEDSKIEYKLMTRLAGDEHFLGLWYFTLIALHAT